MRNESYGKQSPNWGLADTYYHTRWMPQVGNYNGRNRRSDTDGTFQRGNLPNRYVKYSAGDQEGGRQYNRAYNGEESDNPEYYGGHSDGQALLTGNGDNIAPSALETEEIDGRHTDSDVAAYLANRSVSHEYRAAIRMAE